MISPKVFSQVVGVGLAVATVGGFAPFMAIATPSQHSLASTHKLAQSDVGNVAKNQLEGTLVFSQTDRIAIRIYNSDGTLRLNLYNKQTGTTEVRGAPVTVESTDTGTTYRYAGKPTVTVAIAKSGKQTISINNMPQQESKAITGKVFYLPRIALPPNAVVEVSLVDISRADAPTIALSSQKIVSGGRQVPFPFTLLYDSKQIDARLSYAIQARITVDGELQFVTKTGFPVITNGSPTTVDVKVKPVDRATTDKVMLKNTVWRLEQIQYKDGKRLEDTSASKYTVEFMNDGQLSIRADCNRALGRFTENGSSLSIELGPTTLAACPDKSFGQDYLLALGNASTYRFKDGKLFIDIKSNTGTMQFSR